MRKNKVKEIYKKLSTPSELLIDDIENDQIEKDKALLAYKALSTPEERVMDFLENIDDLKGKDGFTPIKGLDYFTNEEIEDFLKKATPKKGKDYKDGETPTEDKLIRLIMPLVPKPIPGKDGTEITADEIRDKLHSLKGDKMLSALHLKDIEWLKEKVNWIQGNIVGGITAVQHDSTLTGDGTYSNPLKVVNSIGSAVYNEIAGGSGTMFTLANTPIVGSVRVYGTRNRLYPHTTVGDGNDYTISGSTITIVQGSYNAGDILVDYNM